MNKFGNHSVGALGVISIVVTSIHKPVVAVVSCAGVTTFWPPEAEAISRPSAQPIAK